MDFDFAHMIAPVYLFLLAFAASGSGLLLLRKTGVRFFSRGETLVFSIGTGLGILSMGVFTLAVVQFLNRSCIIAFLIAVAVAAVFGWWSFLEERPRKIPHFRFGTLDRCAGILILISLFAAILIASTPAFRNDELSYHLAVPRHYLAKGGFYFIPGNLFSNYPLNGEMLYVVCLVLGGDILAKGLHFALSLLTLEAMRQLIRRHLPETGPRLLPLLIFITTPSVLITAGLAYTDLFLAAYAFLALYAFINWYESEETGWLVLSGALTGLAMGSKYGGLLLPLLGLLGVLFGTRRHRLGPRGALRRMGAYGLAALLLGSGFYVKNWILTGNPLYPFFFDLFGGRGWSSEQARYYDLFLHELGMGRTLMDYLLLPWNLSIHAKLHSTRFDGVLGPVFLLTLPFLVGLRSFPSRIKILILYSGFSFLFWIFSVQQIRYLIPALPASAVLAGYVVSRYRERKAVFTFLILLVGASICINGYHTGQEFLRIKPYRYVLQKETRNEFLSRLIPSYDMFDYINTRLPLDAKVFLVYMKNPGFLCERAYYSDSMFESFTVQQVLVRAVSTESIYSFFKEGGFTHILYDDRYVFGELTPFSEEEKQKFLTFQKRHLKLKSEEKTYYLFSLNPKTSE